MLSKKIKVAVKIYYEHDTIDEVAMGFIVQ